MTAPNLEISGASIHATAAQKKRILFFTAVIFLLILFSSRIGPWGPLLPKAVLFWSAHLSLLLLFISFAWYGPVWGVLTLLGTLAILLMVGLASRDWLMFALPFQAALLGAIAYWGVEQHRKPYQETSVALEKQLQEVNSLQSDLAHLEELHRGSVQRLSRYQHLRRIANALNLTLDTEALLEVIVQSSSELVKNADHVLLYLADDKGLELRKVWRRAGTLTIKAKRGDALDQWVMRHAQPLLAEELRHDFRFPEITPELLERPCGAVLAVPLVSEHRFLGVLRLESVQERGLFSDDLRLIRILGDLASLSIENGTLYERMAQLAMTDDLTGLMVREQFLKQFKREILNSQKTQKPFAVLLIDMDHFKSYNDRFGHSAGDKLLKQIARILNNFRRPGDAAGRYGGEEFVSLFCQTDRDEAIKRAENIRERIASTPIELRREVAQVSVSIGVAFYPEDGTDPMVLLGAADKRLYQAKAQGRNRVCHSG